MSESAVPVSRRARVSSRGQPEIESDPSAGGPTAAIRRIEMPSGLRSFVCSLTSQAAHGLLRMTGRKESASVIGHFHHV